MLDFDDLELAAASERMRQECAKPRPCRSWSSTSTSPRTSCAGELENASSYAFRWAVNINEWVPEGDDQGPEFRFLVGLIKEEQDRLAVDKFLHYEDKKRALISRLLGRQASASVLGHSSFDGLAIRRTLGKKPFLEFPLPPEDEAPNWNFNVSHEGSWVVLASEPFCVAGVDVTNRRKCNLRRDGEDTDIFSSFSDFLAEPEWQDVRAAGSREDQCETFSRYWGAKEAFVKARGDGLAYNVRNVVFRWTPLPVGPGGEHHRYEGTAQIDGELSTVWHFAQEKLPCKDSWVTVARGPLTAIVDSEGSLKATHRKSHPAISTREWERAVRTDRPLFSVLPVRALVPSDELAEYDRVVSAGFKHSAVLQEHSDTASSSDEGGSSWWW